MTHLLAGEVDTNSTFTEQASIELELLTRHTRDNNITQGDNVLHCRALKINNLVSVLLQSLTTSELLHTSDINTVHTSSVIGQQSSKRASYDLGPVHNANGVAEQSVSVRQNSVVDVQVLEDLNVGQRRAGQDALLALGFGVEEADVLVHVEDVAVAETFDILGDIDYLLQVLVLAVVENGVVDNDAVNVGVGVGIDNLFLDVVAANFAEGVLESTVVS
jgi:hypothetical protein